MTKVIWLQTPSQFWLGGGNHFSQLLNIHEVNDGRQTEIAHTDVPLVPEPSAYEVKLAIERLQ
jgi:hypothetical protein